MSIIPQFKKRRGGDTQTPKRDHIKMKEETGIMLPQDRECQKPREAGRGKEELTPRAFRGRVVLRTP